MANKKNEKESLSLLKRFWFVGVVALLLVVFIGLYAKDAYDNRKVYVNAKEIDGKYALFSLDDSYYMADDLYDALSSQSGLSAKVEQFTSAVLNASIETTDDMKTFADNVAANYAMASSSDVQNMFDGMSSMGYDASLDGLRQYCITYRKKIEMSKAYYNEHLDEYRENIEQMIKPMKVSHILVKTTVNQSTDDEGKTVYEAAPTEEESAKLQAVLDALASGKDFAEVAKEYSEDGSAADGGSLGLSDLSRNVSSYVKPFADAANALGYGETSDVVISQYGWHIIKVEKPTDEEFQTLLDDSDFLTELNTLYPDAYLGRLQELAEAHNAVIADEDLKNAIYPSTGGEQ